MKTDKQGMGAMRDAMRQATQLVRVRGPLAATRFIQRLLGTREAAPSPQPTPARDTSQFESAPEAVAEVVLDRAMPDAPSVDERPETLPAERGQFLSKRFSGAAGARNFKLYIPACYAGTPLPLVVMLHGCTQDPDDFALGTRANRWAEEKRCLVAYPEQVQRANSHRCWNWFRPADQHVGAGEPALIAGITQQILAEYQIDTRRVYIAGLSAGGAMTAIMGQTYSDLFAAIGVHSGLPVGAAHDVSSALALMKTGRSLPTRSLFTAAVTREAGVTSRVVPMIVFHGDSDQTVNPINAKRLVEDSVAAHQSINRTSPLQRNVERIEPTQANHGYSRTRYLDSKGASVIEHWEIDGAAHAWAGGDAAGSYSDARGPDATRAMLEFFDQHLAPGVLVPDVTDSSILK